MRKNSTFFCRISSDRLPVELTVELIEYDHEWPGYVLIRYLDGNDTDYIDDNRILSVWEVKVYGPQ